MAWQEMSHYPWKGEMLYLGSIVLSTQLPWHYIPLWMLISIPATYLLFFAVGVFSIPVHVRKHLQTLQGSFKVLIWLLFFGPLLAIIALHAVVYDGWRHMYFLYTPLIFIALEGFKALFLFVQKRLNERISFNACMVLFAIPVFAFPAFRIIKDHPHESVYFNEPARAFFAPIGNYFELDYWGLSFRSLLEKILREDNSDRIDVESKGLPCENNARMLTEEERQRLFVSDLPKFSNYHVADFRGRMPEADDPGKTYIKIENSSGVLLKAYKSDKMNVVSRGLYSCFQDFENLPEGNGISESLAHSGRKCNVLDRSAQFGYTVRYMLTEDVNDQIELSVSAWINASRRNPDMSLVFSVERKDAVIYWDAKRFIGLINASDTWIEEGWNTFCNSGLKKGDLVSVYFWSHDRHPVYIDDLSVKLNQVRKQEKAQE
jgi:hypothetical protein